MNKHKVYNEEVETKCKDVYCIPDLKTDVEGGMVCTISIGDSLWTVFVPDCNDGIVLIGKEKLQNCDNAKIMQELACGAIERGLDPNEFEVVKDDANNEWFVVYSNVNYDEQINIDDDDNDNFDYNYDDYDGEVDKNLASDDSEVSYYSCDDDAETWEPLSEEDVWVF